jgi:hypothetical protein
MSITRTTFVDCRCGARLEALVADSLNAARHPHLKQAVIERKLHLFVCALCQRPITVEKEMLYVDIPRRQFIGVYPEAERARERACGEELLRVFAQTVADNAPGVVRELASDFFVRVVFGYEELREKIVADDAGLSDLLLEIIKGQLIANDPAWVARGVLTFRLERVRGDGDLVLTPAWADGFHVGESEGEPIVVERALYDALYARRDELFADPRGVASGPHCSLLRLLDRAGPP